RVGEWKRSSRAARHMPARKLDRERRRKSNRAAPPSDLEHARIARLLLVVRAKFLHHLRNAAAIVADRFGVPAALSRGTRLVADVVDLVPVDLELVLKRRLAQFRDGLAQLVDKSVGSVALHLHVRSAAQPFAAGESDSRPPAA